MNYFHDRNKKNTAQPNAGEGPGYLRGVLESIWFRKL